MLRVYVCYSVGCLILVGHLLWMLESLIQPNAEGNVLTFSILVFCQFFFLPRFLCQPGLVSKEKLHLTCSVLLSELLSPEHSYDLILQLLFISCHETNVCCISCHFRMRWCNPSTYLCKLDMSNFVYFSVSGALSIKPFHISASFYIHLTII